jgi:hypothetical protein
MQRGANNRPKRNRAIWDGIDVTMIGRFISLLGSVWRRLLLLPHAIGGHLPCPARMTDLAWR